MATRLMIASVYDAFRQAGAEDGLARAALEDIAAYDSRLNAIERKLDALDAKVDPVAARVDAQFATLDAKIEGSAARLDTKIDALDKRFTLLFGLLLAMQVATLGLVLRLSVG